MTELLDPLADRLLKSSARHSYDPELDIDWDAPLLGTWAMQPERMSLYGTTLWEGLTEEQQIELSRHEVASISSVGVWFEILLMQMMLRELYDEDPRTQRAHYALTEIGDETRHSLMFGKAIARMGVPAYGPIPRVHRLGKLFNVAAHGVSAYASILVAEEILDRWQREVIKDDRIEPLVRMTCRIHVTEEARHMTFARDEVERMLPTLSKAQLLYHQVITAQVCFMVARALVNPAVYDVVGLDRHEARRAALRNPHYRDTMAWMGEKVTEWLREHDLMPAHQMKAWRASLLVPSPLRG